MKPKGTEPFVMLPRQPGGTREERAGTARRLHTEVIGWVDGEVCDETAQGLMGKAGGDR
jgi:hypothetical protein